MIDRTFDFSIDLTDAPFNRVADGVYVGARPQPAGLQALEEAGITHVISCLEETERGSVAFLRERFETVFIPVRDSIDSDIAASFPEAFAFASRAQASPSKAGLLVHCAVGVSRSATVATALVMQRQALTFLDAYRSVRAGRPKVLPNIGFASQLQRLEHSMHAETRGELSSLARYLREVCNVPVEIEVLQEMLERHDYDAPRAIRAIFGGDIPRVVQGVRL
ncbi:MAG: dual specificity protein phosphatase family protein [Deltaproteobacteria bacterium]|nr:dual specificity protein phosphatase family protein [Deltaproteobacteria bacterium]